jgi:hypothetical protein
MRIVATTTSCGKCSNRIYESGGVYTCKLVGERIRSDAQVAPFCPLPVYPSRIISSLDATVESLRNAYSYTLPYAIFSFLAAKLKARISADGRSIHLLVKDGKEERDFHILMDRLTGIDYERSLIRFLDADSLKEYKICAGQECSLLEKVEIGEGKTGDLEVPFRVAP